MPLRVFSQSHLFGRNGVPVCNFRRVEHFHFPALSRNTRRNDGHHHLRRYQGRAGTHTQQLARFRTRAFGENPKYAAAFQHGIRRCERLGVVVRFPHNRKSAEHRNELSQEFMLKKLLLRHITDGSLLPDSEQHRVGERLVVCTDDIRARFRQIVPAGKAVAV